IRITLLSVEVSSAEEKLILKFSANASGCLLVGLVSGHGFAVVGSHVVGQRRQVLSAQHQALRVSDVGKSRLFVVHRFSPPFCFGLLVKSIDLRERGRGMNPGSPRAPSQQSRTTPSFSATIRLPVCA